LRRQSRRSNSAALILAVPRAHGSRTVGAGITVAHRRHY
jgi:hypothetical protein